MKNIVFLFLLGLLIFTIYSCKSNPVDPPPVKVEVQPGSRNYTWDVTTLETDAGAYALICEIWGANPNDIWAVGDAGLSYYGAWHFNGSSWQYGTTTSTYGQTAIWGSSSNNVWMGNGGGVLWRFNGSVWTYYTRLKLPNYEQFTIQRIWGVSEKEVYLIGAKINGPDPTEEIGIFKFNGSGWKRIDMPKIYKNGFQVVKDINGDLLFISTEYGNDKMTLYSWNGTELKILANSDSWTMLIKRIGERTMIVNEKKIYEYADGNMELVNDMSGLNRDFGITCGRNEKDMFIGHGGFNSESIYHYNGTDVVEIYKLNPGVFPLQGCIFEKDVYILLFDSNIRKSKILHGKLKE